MNIKKLFLIISLFIACSAADSFAQLTKIWELKNFMSGIAVYSEHSKLASVAYQGTSLVDLTNGNIITTVVPPYNVILLDYSGKRYFIDNWFEKTFKVYDRYTNEFIQNLPYENYPYPNELQTAPDDSTMFGFDTKTHTLQFWNIYTNELKESFKIPNTPDVSTYNILSGQSYSYDGRYFAFYMMPNVNPEFKYFLLYDRLAKEIIMQKTLPINTGFLFKFMNTSNLCAYGETLKLEGDYKPYSYIRIYAPDQRKVIRDIKIANEENYIFYLLFSQNDKFIIYLTNPSNDTRFYDYANNKKNDFLITNAVGPIYLDDSLYISGSMKGYKFDWTVVGVKEPQNSEIVIYPNPTNNAINLNIEPKYFNGNWEISNLTGQILLKGEISNNENFQLDISNLPPATYFLRISNGEEIKVEKVVKW
jgi:hypothetical protein